MSRSGRTYRGELARESGGACLLQVVGWAVLLIAMLVAFVVWGAFCRRSDSGEQAGAVIERYRPRFAEMRAKLKRISEKLPAEAGDPLPAKLDPKPVYDVPNRTFNTAFLMAVYCFDPDYEELTARDRFDLLFHEDEFHTHLRWTGRKSPLVEAARKVHHVGLPERMERSLNLRYLVVAREVRFVVPRAIGENTFDGGELDLDVFLVDLPAEKVLGGFRRTFRPDPQVMVTFARDRKPNESAEAFVRSNVWSKARVGVAEELARQTGGTFVIDRNK